MREKTRLADPHLERRLFARRAMVALGVVVALSLGLAARLYNLQVANHDHYVTLSDGNRIRIEPVPPTRGLILDREGRLLADNLPSFTLELTPERVPDMAQTLTDLAAIVSVRPQDLARFSDQLRRQRRFEPVPLRFRLSEAELAAFAVNRHRFPGVDVRATLTRRYPHGDIGVHAVGYVGAISEAELQRVDAAAYSGTTHFGKTGVEAAYESTLHGTVGYRQVETNAQGRVLRVLEYTPPVPGADVHLTIDLELQHAAVAALGDRAGAVVAIDPRNGEVLALVSRPGFDPNRFVDGFEAEAFTALERDARRPLFNRAVRGRYPPGSTVKPFLALAAHAANAPILRKTIFCEGFFRLPGGERRFRDWKREGHGQVGLQRAVIESCDVYFYQLALELGIDFMHRFLTTAGFGRPTGIDLVGELAGLMPSREWKRSTMNQPWFHGETVIVGVGQGYMLSTPLQLAHSTAILAGRGSAFRPHVVQMVGPGGAVKPEPIKPLPGIAAPVWKETVQAMVDVLHTPRGTAAGAGRGAQILIAGKTGTAQVYTLSQEDDKRVDPQSIAEHLRDHALFVAFAPADAPTIAVAAVVEHGGGGGSVAAPVARAIIDAWMELEGRD